MQTTAVGDDVLLVMTALVHRLRQRVRDRLAEAGYGDLRDSHGYLFQHLMPGPVSVNALAAALGVTQQAASKSAIELERLGYVRRTDDPADRRVRVVALTERGEASMAAARRARAEITEEVRARLGEDVVRALREYAEETGAYGELAGRRLRPFS